MMNFHTLTELPGTLVAQLTQRALQLAQARPTPLVGARRALGLLFLAPSLRTQASMQRAGQLLGLDIVSLGSNLWAFETKPGVVMDGDTAEHVSEAAAVLGSYVDVLGLRSFPDRRSWDEDQAEPVWNAFAEFAGIPLINLESPRWHPCQALADRAALEHLGVDRRAKIVVHWTWHPKALPHAVANSSICMAAQRGMDVVLLRPTGYDLAPDTYARAEALAQSSGGTFRVSDDPSETRDAAVVLAKSWGSIEHWTNPAAEAQQRAALRNWRVTPSTLAPGAHFFHCLPVRRNVVVDDAVLDSSASQVLLQAKYRVHAQTAVLEHWLATETTTLTPATNLVS